MRLHDFYASITLTEEIALDHYNKLNGEVDYNLPGVCNHYFAKYDWNRERSGEICLTCKVSKTVKGQLRYTYQVDGKRIAKREIDHKFLMLGAFQS
jgi:hypothetical protein